MKSMWMLAFAAGTVLPLQALINARLGRDVGGPIWAAAVSFAIGTAALLAWIGLRRVGPLTMGAAATAPGWVWSGGVLGAFYVASVVVAVPRLGAASLVALVVFGQMTASVLLDHFGVLSPLHPVTIPRVVGGALVVLGVWLVVNH